MATLLTKNTLKGLYRVKRPPFGVAAAPAIFQRFMETTLSGIQGTCVYLDSGSTVEEHATRLTMVLERLKAANLRLSREKCKFRVPEVRFLRPKVDAAGIHTTQDKVRAIMEAPPPTSKQSLQAFLGLLSFYGRFLEQRATVATAMYQLLQKDVAWTWEDRHQEAFESLKRLLLQKTVLTHYDPAKPLVISCDASPYGVGAVLAQEDSWGREAPIALALCTLRPAERNYSQLDREGLAVIFTAQHFQKFIADRKVTFITDHQLLLGILGSRKFCHHA